MDPYSSGGHGYTERHSSQSFRRVSKFRDQSRIKTGHRFSAIDQGHEQSNAAVKDDGREVGLTENLAALRHRMVLAPAMARLIGKFEASIEKRKKLKL